MITLSALDLNFYIKLIFILIFITINIYVYKNEKNIEASLLGTTGAEDPVLTLGKAQNLISLTEKSNLGEDIINVPEREVKENSLLPDNIYEFFLTQNGLGQLCITLLIGNYVVLSAVFSIIAILYGEYLINRYNLETRYPKLAAIIKLRKKFQKYYLIFSISSIIITVSTQSALFIYILTL